MLASCSRRRLWWTVLLGTALLLEALSASATTKNGVVVTPAASASFWGWLGRKGGSDRKAMAEASSMTRDACEAMVVREPRRGRVVTFKAKGKRSIKLRGDSRSLREFLSSEAVRSSIFGTENIQEAKDGTFRCEMDPIQLFSARLVPVMHVRLRLNPQTSSASIFAKGNQVSQIEVGDAGGGDEVVASSFLMDSTNKITWVEEDDSNIRLTSELSLEISFEKPHWLLAPNSLMNAIGGSVLKQSLKKSIPEFLQRIATAYELYNLVEVV